MLRITLICSIILCLLLPPYDIPLSQERLKELEQIRAEIRRYREKLTEEEKKERSALDHIANLDKEISLLRKLIRALKKEETEKENQIKKINAELTRTEASLERLKKAFAKRAVYFYKYGRIKELEILLSSRSLNQAYVWLKYRRLISQNDMRNYKNILRKKNQIERIRKSLQKRLSESKKIIEEKKREEENLKKKRREKSKILAQIRRDKEIYQRKLEEYRKAAEEIMRLISEEESKRMATLEGREEVSTFPQLKGKMIWPTNGKIISRFGKQRHPKFNTVTENLGIDIQAPLGQEVRCVSEGKVTAITWQRGRGNILIISHYGGYYTVYAHLSEILVNVGEEVRQGQVIGKVGDLGSLEGPMLHFEIWHHTLNYNPEEWLQ